MNSKETRLGSKCDWQDDIAIVGMACVVPGANNLETYWNNILNKVDAVGDPPPGWDTGHCLEAAADANNRIYCARGGYLGHLASFDPIQYGIMPNSVDGGEPDHYLALRIADAALLDAGYRDRPPPRERVEVIIGRGSYVNRGNTTAIQHGIIVDQFIDVLKQLHSEHTEEELQRLRSALISSLPPFHAETAAALVPNIISGRIANRLDFMGTNFIVDAACASSLIAVDIGMRDLQSGRCDLALVGGIHASTPPVIVMIFCQIEAISRSGQIRPFDSRADGTLLGEGGGMIALKRRLDAERDGDRIYAILKGVGTASDGRAHGLLAPRVEGEVLAIRRAYETAGIKPSSVGLIEAHGTATIVGDNTEIGALRQVFVSQEAPAIEAGFRHRQERKRPIALGSVKSMISHLMPASGIAGLIKIALALHHRVLPPTIHCEEPSPDLDRGPFYLNTETRPWIHYDTETPRRAAINAFGFGGINAHAILEEYSNETGPNLVRRWDSELVLLSASDKERLIARIDHLEQQIREAGDIDLAAVARLLNISTHAPCRLALIARSTQDLADKLERAGRKLKDHATHQIRDRSGIYYNPEPLAAEGGIAFLFPGEGSQYTNMLRDLCLHFPEVRQCFDLMDRAFADHARGYLPSEAIFPVTASPEHDDLLWRMDAGAEAVFAANQALAALLSGLGIRPDAVVGHSTGEHSALLFSGALALTDDNDLLAHIRSVNAIYTDIDSQGDIPSAELVAVGGADSALLQQLVLDSDGRLSIAMDNCPHQAVLCGHPKIPKPSRQILESARAICQPLPFARAYHTPLFEFFCRPMREHFDRMRVERPSIPIYSCVTAARFPEDPDSIRDLAARQWAKPVRFRETVKTMYTEGIRMFVEVGPRGNLTGFVSDTLRGQRHLAIASNLQSQSGIHQLNTLLAQLFANGVNMQLAPLYEHRAIKPADLDLAPLKPSRQPVVIRTELQPLSLPADFKFASTQHKEPSGTDGLARHTSSTEPLPTVGQNPAEDLQGIGGLSRAPWNDGAPQALMGHFEMMQDFLDLQSRVIQMYLARKSGAMSIPTAASPTVGEHWQKIPSQSTMVPPALKGNEAGPLAGEVAILEPGRHARAVRRISIDADPFLQHHTLGRQVSDADPALNGLPVLPFTGTMELLGEVASCLAPGKVLTELREVRAYRWIRAPSSIDLVTDARLRDDGGIESRVHELSADGTLGSLLAEATVYFAASYPASPSTPRWRPHNPSPSNWKNKELYRQGMFHGPAFQMVTDIIESGSDGARAKLVVPDRAKLFRDDAKPQFLIDPVLNDGPGQIVAFWIMEHHSSGTDIFPYRLGSLQVFGPTLPEGSRLECCVQPKLVGQGLISSDMWISNELGQVWCRFRDWEDRRFDLPKSLVALRNEPRKAFISRRCTIPGITDHADIACRFIDGFSPAFFQASNGIWGDMLAYLILSSQERVSWRKLARAPAEERRTWLLRRCAIKDAVRNVVCHRHHIELAPADIHVEFDEREEPEATGDWVQRLGIQPSVMAFDLRDVLLAAAAVSNTQLAGIDRTNVDYVPDMPD